jgi:hypothetical protein
MYPFTVDGNIINIPLHNEFLSGFELNKLSPPQTITIPPFTKVHYKNFNLAELQSGPILRKLTLKEALDLLKFTYTVL